MAKKIFTAICMSFLTLVSIAQVDTTFIYNASTPFGILDLRLAKSATRYYYLQENKTFSFRESAPGVKTDTYRDMTSWNSAPYTQGNLREKNGIQDNFVMNYRLLFPGTYRSTYSPGYPLIVMMHGAGERGNCWDSQCYFGTVAWNPTTNNPPAPTDPTSELLNNDHNLMNGGGVHLDARNLAGSKLPNDPTLPTRAFPGFVLFPQNLNGWSAPTIQDAIRLVRLISKKYNIDENRIYIHGLSNGGSATYEAIKRAPWLFAATLTMSSVSDGGIITQNLTANTAHIPLWSFQGGIDTSPSPTKTAGYIKTFRDAGTEVRYTIYPNLGHGTWNTAYKEPDFFMWMLSKNKSNIHTFSGTTAICLTNGQGVQMELAKGFFKYEWQFNGAIIPDATNATYVANAPGVYRARFSRVPNPTESQWNIWSSDVSVTTQNPAQAQMEQIGTLLLKDLNNAADAHLRAVGNFAHYYWYKDGALVDLTGSQDDTVKYATLKAGTCTAACTGNGNYTLVTAGYDNCPSPVSDARYIFFNNQAPVNITAASNFAGTILTPSSINLTWADNASNENGYEIWSRKKTGTSTYSTWTMKAITQANVSSFVDAGLEPSTTYNYKIRAVSNTGRSEYTPMVSNQYLVLTTTTDVINPSVPQNLVAATTAIKTVTLSWQPSTDNTGIRQYRIYYGSQTVLTNTSQPNFKLTNLDLNSDYSFTIKAEDLGGNQSDFSTSATANTYVTGLYYEHSTGAWGDLDQIDWSTAEFSGIVNNFTLVPSTQEDYFNFKFEGYLYITTPGVYQFRLLSDDGSRVELDSVAVVNNNGVHESKTVTGPTQTLTSGPKKIVVKYFQYADSKILSVKYKGPDTGNSWINIPDAALRSGTPPASAMATRGMEPVENVTPENKTETTDFSIFPNPASGNDINIRMLTTEDSPVYIKMMDITGRPVYDGKCASAQLQNGIQILQHENLVDGIYIMVLNMGNKSYQHRITVRN